MPRYDYQCHTCDQPFEIEASMTDARDHVTCSHCQSAEVARVFTAVNTIGGGSRSSGSPSLPAPARGGGGCGSGGCGHGH